MKRSKPQGRSARHGKKPAPYTKYGKIPHSYSGDRRTVRGDLVQKANDSLRNKYN